MSFELQLVVDEQATTPRHTVYRMLVDGMDRGQASFYEGELWQEVCRLRRREAKVKEKVTLLQTWGEYEQGDPSCAYVADQAVLSLRRNLLGKWARL